MVETFCKEYERAGVKHFSRRIAEAKKCADAFGVKY
jgi:hypothetical protein